MYRNCCNTQPYYTNHFTHPPSPYTVTPPPQPLIPPAPDMQQAIGAVERTINYNFTNKKLLEEALTHPSYTDSVSNYERLEFVGDAALGLAISNHVYLAYPDLPPGQLTLIRAANISTEKLARVAVKHNLFRFVRHNAASLLDDKVRKFTKAVNLEDDAVAYGGEVKAPKFLADIVESIAAAIYIDVNFDLQRLWVIVRGLLEPIVTPEDLQRQPQPITMLFKWCQKQGKRVDIKHWRKGNKNIASVYVDGSFLTSSSSEQKDLAKLNAAKAALLKLADQIPKSNSLLDVVGCLDGSFEIEGAKQKLHKLCGKKKWTNPIYSIEKESGPGHEKKFVCSVKIETEDGILCMEGEEKARVKDSENSAASLLIRALQESNYFGAS